MRHVVVVDPDPSWPEAFERLHARLWPSLSHVASSIEHVGSTSVPGLAAKPVIDASIVLRSKEALREAIERLAALGYAHRGDLGIDGREAFAPPDLPPVHNLYACPPGSLGLANHLAVRDHLRRHPDAAREYGELKKELARRFPRDIDGYVEGKSAFLLGVLRAAGLARESLAAIERANRRPA